jgi:perosamine synthetase
VIPVYEPDIGEAEAAAVADAIRTGEISGSFGDNLPAFEHEFAAFIGVSHGVAVTSGTTALHLAVAAAGIGPGDEVLVSSSTNIATALAAYHNGATPVGVDSELETWNLDLELIDSLISERTKAIIPVHLFGHPVDMDALMDIAARHGLIVIEDCAESHGATVRDRKTGSFGAMACFSFYANKVITTGEGGMVVTDDDELAERLRLLRNLAFTTPRFVHYEAGYNFRMTGYQAAMGRVQLAKIERVIEAKRKIASTYGELLTSVEGVTTPPEAEWAHNVYWMYAVLIDEDRASSREVAERLKVAEVETRNFFFPMNRQPFLREQPGFVEVPCPVADRLWETGLYLPCSTTLTSTQIQTVADALQAALD